MQQGISRIIGWSRKWVPRHIGGTLLLATLFSVLDAFSDIVQLPPLARLAFWIAVITPCWLSVAATSQLLTFRYRLRGVADRLTIGFLCSVSLALPCSMSVMFVWRHLGGMEINFPETLGYIACFNVIVSTIIIMFSSVSSVPKTDGRSTAPVAVNGGAPTAADLNNRLPRHIRGDIHHIHAQDHYVMVTTDKGSHMLLLRFADALDLVSDLDGKKVHRSHWVARTAVVGLENENGRLSLGLINGEFVPVSRNYRTETRKWLEPAGWR